MAKQAPNPIEVQDFQFKLHCRLNIFCNTDNGTFNKSCHLLANSSRFGLIFVGTASSNFQVIQISSIETKVPKEIEPSEEYIRRIVSIPAPPIHLSLNCDSTMLAVVIEKNGYSFALIYLVSSFMKQAVVIIQEIRLTLSPGICVTQTTWSPTSPSIFTACKSDGTVGLYELKETGVEIKELPSESQAACICWSPKGKQLAVGSSHGQITQYKPDLKAMKSIHPPPSNELQAVIAIEWISSFQFIALYKSVSAETCALYVVDAPKVGDVVFINYEDICYSYGNIRPVQFYTMHQSIWNILLVASSNSMEVGVLGNEKEHWTQWTLSDVARAELPLSSNKQETLPIGLALDTSAVNPIVWGEHSLPPAPFLFLLSHHGVLCCFRIINMKSGVSSICQAPEMFADRSGLSLFTKGANAELKFINPVVESSKESAFPAFSNIQPHKNEKTTAPLKNILTSPLAVSTPPPRTQVPQFGDMKTSVAPTPAPQFSDGKSVATTQLPQFSNIKTSVTPAQFPKFSNVKTSVTSASTLVTGNTLAQANVTKALQEETDFLISKLIREECEILENELQTLISKGQSLKIELGTDSEAVQLVQDADAMQNFLKDVVENSRVQSAEVHSLKQGLIQTWAWYEDARSRYAQSQEASLGTLLRIQQLDPVSQRRSSNIQYLTYYLESQLIQANRVLDEQWENFQDSCKQNAKLKIPTIETIYQTMVRQSAIHQKQIYVLKDISNRIKMQRSKVNSQSLFVSLNQPKPLQKGLSPLRIEPQNIINAQYERILNMQKQLTSSKVKKLGKLLLERDITHVSVNKPQLSNTTLQSFLNSSIQQKQKQKDETSIVTAALSPILSSKCTLTDRQNTISQSTPKIIPIVEKKQDEKPKEIITKVLTTLNPGSGSSGDSVINEVNTSNEINTPKSTQSFSFLFSTTTQSSAPSTVTFTKPTPIPQTKVDTIPTPIFQFTPSTTASMPQFSFTPTTSLSSLFSSSNSFVQATTTTVVETTSIPSIVSSAFVPTTQLAFTFTAKSDTTSASTNTVKSSPSFNFSSPVTGIMTTKVTFPNTTVTSPAAATLFKLSPPKAPTITATTAEGVSFNFKLPSMLSSPTPAVVTVTPISQPANSNKTETTSVPAITTSAFSFSSVSLPQNSIFSFKPSVTQPTLEQQTTFEFSKASDSASKIMTTSSIFSSISKPAVTISGVVVTTTVKSIFSPVMTTSVDTSAVKGTAISDTTITSSSIFGGINTTITNATTTTAPIVFGSPTVPVTTTSSSLFATTVASTSSASIPHIFSAITTASTDVSSTSTSTFSVPAVSESILATAVTSSTSVFTPPTFGTGGKTVFTQAAPPAFPQTTSQSSIFGQPATTVTSSPIFGDTATTRNNAFGTQQAASVFGTTPAFSSTTNIFGTSAPAPLFGSNTSIFGNSSTPPTGFSQSSSAFSFSAAAANIPNSDSKFGFSKPTFSFGNTQQNAQDGAFSFNSLSVGAPNTTASSPMNSPFGQSSNANPFAKPASQDQKPFGGGSLFGSSPSGTSPSIFGGDTSGSMFGNPPQQTFGSSPAFGGNATFGQSPSFGQSNFGSSFGSPQQSGLFSGGGTQSVAQTGFGAFSQTPQKPSAFGGVPVFGGSPSAGFGAPPTFGGGSPAFGAQPSAFGAKVFGEASNTGGTFSGGGQQNSNFGNIASQPTVGFGSLAQQSQPLQNQSPFSNSSSFSTWR